MAPRKRTTSDPGEMLTMVGGPRGGTMLELRLLGETTLDDLIVAFRANTWGIDRADGERVCGPNGTRDPDDGAGKTASGDATADEDG